MSINASPQHRIISAISPSMSFQSIRTSDMKLPERFPSSLGVASRSSGYWLFQPQQHVDLRPRLDQIVDRVVGQHVEERVERLAKRRIEAATIDQRAIGG